MGRAEVIVGHRSLRKKLRCQQPQSPAIGTSAQELPLHSRESTMVTMRPAPSSSSSSDGEGVSRIGLGPALTPSSDGGGQFRLAPPAIPANMKSKKSLEWLSKSFKRKPSSNSVPRSDRKGIQESSRTGGQMTASSEPLLLPEPSSRYSPPGLSSPSTYGGGKSPSDSGASTKSFRFPGGAARDIHEVRLPTLTSESQLSSDKSHTSSSFTTTKPPKQLPLPSPSSIVLSEKTQGSPKRNQDSSASALFGLDGGRETPKVKASTDYEKLLVSLSSRKVLRTMLDE